MNDYFKTLVMRYFVDLFGPDVFRIDYVDGTTGQLNYCYPFEIENGLRILIDENDPTPLARRCKDGIRPRLILRHPQELLSQHVRLWLEQKIGREINLSCIKLSVVRKLKRYRKNRRYPSRRKRMNRAIVESNRLQKQEKDFQCLKKRYRNSTKSN